MTILVRGLAFMLIPAILGAAASVANGADQPAYKVGMGTRNFTPAGDYPWRGSRARTLAVTVWYPAVVSAREEPIEVPPAAPIWQAGSAAIDAPPAASKEGHRLVVLSHGSGGAAIQLAWLGTALARRGYVAAAVNHPGNSYEDTTTLEGFVLRWQRARDLSAVIDGLLADKSLGPRIDVKRIGAAGFSLGGFAVLTLAGARTDLPGFQRYCAQHPEACVPPPEYPNLLQQIDAKARADASFRAALDGADASYRDARVRAVFAMAPPLAHSLARASLGSIAIPVRIVVGDSDRAAPAEENASYYAQHIKGARLDILRGGVGHFVFLDLPTAEGRRTRPLLANDPPGVDRAAIHARIAAMAAGFFGDALR